jgi:hypothetical protein
LVALEEAKNGGERLVAYFYAFALGHSFVVEVLSRGTVENYHAGVEEHVEMQDVEWDLADCPLVPV